MTTNHDSLTVDTWAQVPNERLLAQPWLATVLRWTDQPDLAPTSVADMLSAYDAAGVDRALICGWWGPSGVLISNDEVAATVAEAPERFHGVAAVRELRRAVLELGFVALRVVPWLWNLPPDDRRYYPQYAACVERRVRRIVERGRRAGSTVRRAQNPASDAGAHRVGVHRHAERGRPAAPGVVLPAGRCPGR